MPPYPGAANLVNPGGVLMFTTADAPGAVAQFYNQHMPTLGWKLMSSMPAPQVVQAWSKGSRIASLTAFSKNGQTMVTIALPK